MADGRGPWPLGIKLISPTFDFTAIYVSVVHDYCYVYLTGFIHANQTVHLELSSRPAKRGTAISCNDATVEQLEDKLLAHLNDYNKTIANGTTCEFLPAGSASCKSSGIKFKIVLACAGDRANGNLIDNDSKQKMAITNIMQRRTSESFTAHDVEIIVRLFRDSDRRNSPKPTCNKECSEVEQGPLILCDCPCKCVK